MFQLSKEQIQEQQNDNYLMSIIENKEKLNEEEIQYLDSLDDYIVDREDEDICEGQIERIITINILNRKFIFDFVIHNNDNFDYYSNTFFKEIV